MEELKYEFKYSKENIQQNPYRSTVYSFISHNYPEKEKFFGKLLILFSVQKNEDLKLLESFALALEEIFYTYPIQDNEHISDKKLENIFEQTLKKFNQEFTWLLQSKKIHLNIKETNACIAVIRKNNLIFSQVNDIDIYVLYKNKNNEDKIINIAEPANSRSQLPSNKKLFTNLINGNLEQTHTLLIADKNLSKYLSLYKIKNILLKDKINEIQNNFKMSLLEITNSENFTWLLAKRTNEEIINYEEEIEIENEEIKTEKEKKQWVQLIVNKIYAYKKQQQNKNKKNIHKTVFDETIEVNFGSNVKKLLTFLPFYPSNHDTKDLALPLSKKIKLTLLKLIRFPWFRRSHLIILFILLAIFAFASYYYKEKQLAEEKAKEYENKVLTIKSDLANARSKLIYGDKIGTEQLYYKIKDKINELKEEDQETIKTALDSLYFDLYNIKKITNLIPSTDLSSYADDFYKLIFKNKNLYTYSLDKHILININPNNWQNKILSDNAVISDFQYPSIIEKNNNLYFWTKNNKLWEWNDKSETLEEIELIANPDFSVLDLTNYGNNLYLIDKNTEQIYKMTKTSAGFSKAKEWIMDKNFIKTNKFVDFIIDSNIYILYADKSISQYFRGKKINDFNLENLKPTLETVNKIITSEEMRYIYIVSFPDKRIIVLNKNGVYQKQYLIDLNEQIDDIIILNNKEIYILANQKIYKAILSNT